MPCGAFYRKPIRRFSLSTRVALAAKLARQIQDVLDVACAGYLIVPTPEELNHLYVRACLLVEHLLDTDDLQDLRQAWCRPLESLVEMDAETDEEWWEAESRHTFRPFRARVDETYVRLGSEIVHDEVIDGLIKELRAWLKAYAEYKRQEERRFVRRAEAAGREFREEFEKAGRQTEPVEREKPPMGFRPPKR